jgi:Aspartyl protease
VGNALVPVRFVDNSIVVPVTVNGHEIAMILDSGDAIGPTFTATDAHALGLTQGTEEGIEGAGGGSDVYETTADIAIGALSWPGEVGAIDANLEGQSLIGWPFFAGRCSVFEVDIANAALILIGK